MNIELINTGSELMLGRILNTHQQWICREMADQGYIISRQVSVPDTGAAIEEAVREALGRANLTITTGGLGPTSDDITRDLIAQLLGRELVEDAPAIKNIENFFRTRKRPLPERVKVQAMVPQGAIVLQNTHGLAPGIALEIKPNPFRPGDSGSWLIMLPGPPRELRPMFNESVRPLLRRIFPEAKPFSCRTLRTVSIGESAIQEKIAEPLRHLVEAGLEIGYCASTGQVDVRLARHGLGGERMLDEAEQIVRAQVGSHIFGMEDDQLESVIISLLTKRGETLAVAESCTGGCISNRLTNVPGASAVLLAGLVTYSNASKEKFLGVRPETLAQHGAVSEAVAREMVQGARQNTNATYALSVTGIAGPIGGTPEKPVGTVFIGLSSASGIHVRHSFNPYDRETFKQVTAQQALELLRRKVLRTDD